jgi:hypothetical protein
VYPPQPDDVYRFTQQVKYWTVSSGSDRYRRGMYTYFWRSSPYPFLRTFDAPDSNVTCTRRVRSNTPLQALTLANDEQFVESARALGGRTLRECASGDADRIAYAFRLSLGRVPSAVESERLLELVGVMRESLARAPAEQVSAAAPPQLPDGVSAVEGATWAALGRVLINLDEFITRE